MRRLPRPGLLAGAGVLAAVLAGLWLALGPRTPDLAAQYYRGELFARDGFGVWDNNWYAGHHVPGYSLLFAPLGDLLGTRLVGALAAVACALCFAALARRQFGSTARWGILWLAGATATDLLIGRLTFALGVAVGLGALLAFQRRRLVAAGVLGALCAAASPVAGLFLALAGVAWGLGGPGPGRARLRGVGLVVAVPPVVLTALLGVTFPEGGRQPFGHNAFWGALVLTALAGALLPRGERVLRTGAVLYALAVVASLATHTPMGSNVSRLGAMFSGPLLLCAVMGGRPALTQTLLRGVRERARAPVGVAVLAGTVLALVVYQWNSPVREVAKGLADDSTNASYYAPLEGFLNAHARPLGRLEVPFIRTHWDAALLALRYPLARGWERQLDVRYDPLFYHRGLTAAEYHAWLLSVGVRYVALPDAILDPSSVDEGRLVAGGLAYLKPVWRSAHWRVFELRHARALAGGVGRLTGLEDQAFSVRATRAGDIPVLVRFSPYWQVSAGAGCVTRAPGDWTLVRARGPGPLRVSVRFSLARVLDRGPRCGGTGT